MFPICIHTHQVSTDCKTKEAFPSIIFIFNMTATLGGVVQFQRLAHIKKKKRFINNSQTDEDAVNQNDVKSGEKINCTWS